MYCDKAYGHLKTRLLDYLQSPANAYRHQLTIKHCHPVENANWIEGDGIKYRHTIPFFDKGGFYIGFVDALEKVCVGHSLERYCELAIVAGWISTAVNFQKILTEFSISQTLLEDDKEVWTLKYLKKVIEQYNGVTSGTGARCRPWFNFSIRYGELIDGLKLLRKGIVESRKDDYTYASLQKGFCQIIGVGPLGAQHLIGVLSLGGVIPPKYQNIATMCGGTHTAKTILKYYGLSNTVSEKLKSEVAQELSISEKVVEAGTCEMFRESDFIGNVDMYVFAEENHVATLLERQLRLDHPDTFFFGQIIYVVENNKRYKLKLDKDGKESKVYIPFCPLKVQTSWWVTVKLSRPVYDMEVKTSRNSFFKGMKPKQQLKRKAVTHSGFGIHAGLEDTLQERDCTRMGIPLQEYDSDPLQDYYSDADDPINEFQSTYLRPIQRYNMIQTRGLDPYVVVGQ